MAKNVENCGNCKRIRFEMKRICDLIKSHNYRFSNEKQLQDGIEHVFKANDLEYQREAKGCDGVIDFVVIIPAEDGQIEIGIEVKIKGSPSSVLEQLGRYAKGGDFDGLILVTSRLQLADMPTNIGGVPVANCPLVGSAFA